MKRSCPNCGTKFDITPFTTGKIYCHDRCKLEFNRIRNKNLAKKRVKKKFKEALENGSLDIND